MANKEQLSALRQGAKAWSAWRREHPIIEPNLYRADLHGAVLRGAKLDRANLREADLHGADLRRAKLGGTNLDGADLRGANLREADLRRADLYKAYLREADLRGANFYKACLREAYLYGAYLGEENFRKADLRQANFVRAHLGRADFCGADLRQANFVRADLWEANLDRADLRGADLSWADIGRANLGSVNLGGVIMNETVLGNVDLSNCKNLESCIHHGPSTIDHRTLQRSGQLPLAFLRGVGLPDTLIDYLPSLLGQPIQLYSCFISYSSKDEAFAHRLHADLQNKGVRCWFAPEDMKIGDRIGDTIDTAIRLRDKLLLILSGTSMPSAWVTKEVRTALVEEERHGRPVLFPIRIDDAVMDTTEQWAHDIRRTRHIGDFTRWKEHDAYQKAFERLLRDLRVEKG